jgi:hypothetical protein
MTLGGPEGRFGRFGEEKSLLPLPGFEAQMIKYALKIRDHKLVRFVAVVTESKETNFNPL